MAVKKIEKSAEGTSTSGKKTAKKVAHEYFYGVGRRKTSVAQVRIYPSKKAVEGDVVINDKKLKDYFPVASTQAIVLSPLRVTGQLTNFTATVHVSGGGMTGQVDAIKLGIARALVKFDETLKKSLRDNDLLTRDARKVERKKPGLKKARRAPQWAKR